MFNLIMEQNNHQINVVVHINIQLIIANNQYNVQIIVVRYLDINIFKDYIVFKTVLEIMLFQQMENIVVLVVNIILMKIMLNNVYLNVHKIIMKFQNKIDIIVYKIVHLQIINIYNLNNVLNNVMVNMLNLKILIIKLVIILANITLKVTINIVTLSVMKHINIIIHHKEINVYKIVMKYLLVIHKILNVLMNVQEIMLIQ